MVVKDCEVIKVKGYGCGILAGSIRMAIATFLCLILQLQATFLTVAKKQGKFSGDVALRVFRETTPAQQIAKQYAGTLLMRRGDGVLTCFEVNLCVVQVCCRLRRT